MSNPTETLMANLVHAIRTRETVTIGGGRFSPGELREAVQGLARAPTAPDPSDAIIAELVAALTSIKEGARTGRWIHDETGEALDGDEGDDVPDATWEPYDDEENALWMEGIVETADKAIAKAAALTPAPVTIRVTVDGGVVQSVECSQPARVVQVDYDIEGADESDLEEYGNAEAYVSRFMADPLDGEA